MATQRYPADFAVNGPSVDYIEMQFIRRNYGDSEVKYKTVDALGKILINVPQKVTEAISQQFNQSALGELGRFLAGRSNAAGAVGDALRRTAENFLLDKSTEVANRLGATNLSASGLLSATTVLYSTQILRFFTKDQISEHLTFSSICLRNPERMHKQFIIS